jgi:hypothetical protein
MSLPIWSANTAVLAGKLVSKVVTDGTAWVATTAGTTGAVQPTWPTNEPWTVTDGTAVWGLTTSFRTLTTSGLLTLLTNFRNANPNLLKGVASERPKSMTMLDLPGAYIAGADEQVSFGIQIQTRTLTGLSVVTVDVVPDNIEAGGRQDVLVDAMVGLFAAGYRAIDSKSILQLSSVSDFPIDEGGIPYLGTLYQLSPTSKTEGVAQTP